MDVPFQLAMMAAETLQAALVTLLLQKRMYRYAPLFFTFSVCLLFTSGAEFALLWARGFTPSDYARAYWTLSTIETAFGLAALCELLDCGRFSILAGVTVGTLALRFPASNLGMVACVGLLLLAVGATVRGFRENRFIPSGFVVLYFFQALAFLPRIPYGARYLPVVAWMIASWHWRQEIHSRC